MNDKEKLQLAKEALQYVEKYHIDSRNWGMIMTKVSTTLEKIK